jgi:hypothetical protein
VPDTLYSVEVTAKDAILSLIKAMFKEMVDQRYPLSSRNIISWVVGKRTNKKFLFA